MSRRRAVLLLLIVAGLAALPVSDAAGKHRPTVLPAYVPKNAAARARIARRDAASRLITRALAQVRTHHPACFPEAAPPATTYSDADPDPAIVAELAPLRRPASDADTAAETALEQGFLKYFGGTVYRRSVRVLTAADGQQVDLVVGQDAHIVPALPAECGTLELAALRRLAARAPEPVAALALRYGRHLADARPSTPGPPTDGVFSFATNADGTASAGGGGGDAASFAKSGNFISTGGTAGGPGSQVTGLVPDGVASVEFVGPRVVSRGRDYKPTRYPSAIDRTVAVRDNAVSLHLARPADGIFGLRMTWRDAAGNVIGHAGMGRARVSG